MEQKYMQLYQFEKIYSEMAKEFGKIKKGDEGQYEEKLDLCQYFEHKKLKGYADFFNSSSSFCCGVI